MEKESTAVFFLDILLKDGEPDGLELGRLLREKYPSSKLIFLTSEANLAFRTYEYQLEATDYIIKDPADMLESGNARLQERIGGVLRTIAEQTQLRARAEKLRIQAGNRYIYISPEEVEYVNAVKETHQVEIFLNERKVTAGLSLTELKTMLGEEFWYCNRSCIVNIHKIRELDRKERFLWLESGSRCEVAYREMNKFRKLMGNSR